MRVQNSWTAETLVQPRTSYLSGVTPKRDTASVRPLKVISDSPEPVVEADSDISSEYDDAEDRHPFATGTEYLKKQY